MSNSKSQQEFLDAVLGGKNVSLDGKAGTGKSYITKQAMQLLKDRGKNVMACAPTGIAATNVQGVTVHSAFGLSPHGLLTFDKCNFLKTEKRRVLKAVDVFFIDEKSMLRCDILDAINWTLIKNGCGGLQEKQVVFVGDMKQLKAVADDNMKSIMLEVYDGIEYYHSLIYPKLEVTEIELVEMQRQSDPEFIDNLNLVRDGIKAFSYFKRFIHTEADGIILAPHNSTVARYNIDGFNLAEGKEYYFKATIDGDAKEKDFNFESEIRVKDGCKIMYLVNSKNNNLVNGTLGIFRQRDTEEGSKYFIEVDGVQYLLEKQCAEKFEYILNQEENKLELKSIGSITQYPFKLAYALTIHKSQGLTFENATIDLSLPCFTEGQLYVAFSRVKTPEGLRIIMPKLNK